MNTMNLCKTISIFLQINKISDDTYINNNYINVITSVKMTSKLKMRERQKSQKNHRKTKILQNSSFANEYCKSFATKFCKRVDQNCTRI